MTSVPTWTTSPTTRPHCSPPCKPPPPGLPGCPSWEGGRCACGGTPASWRLAPHPSSCWLGVGAPCDLKTFSSPKAPQNRSRTNGNVTTSATEAWCRTTLLAVSDLVCGEWVGGGVPGGWKTATRLGRKVIPVLSTTGPWVWSQLCHGPLRLHPFFLLGPPSLELVQEMSANLDGPTGWPLPQPVPSNSVIFFLKNCER